MEIRDYDGGYVLRILGERDSYFEIMSGERVTQSGFDFELVAVESPDCGPCHGDLVGVSFLFEAVEGCRTDRHGGDGDETDEAEHGDD